MAAADHSLRSRGGGDGSSFARCPLAFVLLVLVRDLPGHPSAGPVFPPPSAADLRPWCQETAHLHEATPCIARRGPELFLSGCVLPADAAPSSSATPASSQVVWGRGPSGGSTPSGWKFRASLRRRSRPVRFRVAFALKGDAVAALSRIDHQPHGGCSGSSSHGPCTRSLHSLLLSGNGDLRLQPVVPRPACAGTAFAIEDMKLRA